ncbi:MAG: 50S ribosomal protein L25 [Acidimicrobiales bacterium]
MDEVSLVADVGRVKGSSESRRLRRAGKVPGVLYGHGIDPIDVAVGSRELRAALTSASGLNALISIDVGGTNHLAMARQLQRHPTRRTIDHVDFVIVRRDEIISAEVPVHLAGEADKVEKADGMVEHTMFSLMVHATPGDIPSSIEVDISDLAIGDVIRVGDLKLPPGVTTDVDPDDPIVAGATTRMAAEPEGEDAEPTAGADAGGEAAAEGAGEAEEG